MNQFELINSELNKDNKYLPKITDNTSLPTKLEHSLIEKPIIEQRENNFIDGEWSYVSEKPKKKKRNPVTIFLKAIREVVKEEIEEHHRKKKEMKKLEHTKRKKYIPECYVRKPIEPEPYRMMPKQHRRHGENPRINITNIYANNVNIDMRGH